MYIVQQCSKWVTVKWLETNKNHKLCMKHNKAHIFGILVYINKNQFFKKTHNSNITFKCVLQYISGVLGNVW